MKRWILRESPPEEVLENLSGYSDFLRNFLFWRGVETAHDAHVFLNPDYERDFHDPEGLLNMSRACERIEKAVHNKEKIAVYADYDADGIPGSVVVSDFFKKIGFENFVVYIPHRYKEGYGLNTAAIQTLKNQNVSLILTIDCGITDINEVSFAKNLGIDVVVTDHHLPGEILPPAYTVINQNQKNDTYKNRNLCGGGIAFKVVQALIKRGNITKDMPIGWEKWFLDVAGISTISDMVSLTGENRALAYFGVQVLRQSRRPGLKKLFQRKRITQMHITEEDVGFVIAPHINAASRMSSPTDAFTLLSTNDWEEAHKIALYLSKKNEERKEIVETIIREIEDILACKEIKEVVSLGNLAWQPGLLGLAANRVSEKYNRPVCLWGGTEDGTIRGSCRSDGSINIVELMNNASPMFIDSGGHEYSGGFSITQENVDLLEERLLASYKESEKKKIVDSETKIIDMKLPKEAITWGTYNELSKLAPFGMGNEKPLFLIENIKIKFITFFGKTKNHLKIIFDLGSEKTIHGVSFFIDPKKFSYFKNGQSVDVVAQLEKDTFFKVPELRLRIIDIPYK